MLKASIFRIPVGDDGENAPSATPEKGLAHRV